MILAIAPFVPLMLLLAAAVGGVIYASRHHQALPPPGGLSPTTDEKLVLSIAGSTGTLQRDGTSWAWSISGGPDAGASGSDADSGMAALAMLTVLDKGAQDQPFTGRVSGPNTHELEVGGKIDADGVWTWTLTQQSKLPELSPGHPAPPALLDSGNGDTRVEAVAEALGAAATRMTWLTIQPFEGAGAPMPSSLPGLAIVGNQVGITSLAAWLAYDAPHVRAHLEAGHDAATIFETEIGDPGDDARLNGKPIAEVQANVAKLVNEVASGAYQGTASPDAAIAAALVGAETKVTDAWGGAYKNHFILARPATGGGGLQAAGDRWEYVLWAGESRGFDDEAIERKTMPMGKSRSQTIRFAKQRIDQGLPKGDGQSGGDTGATVDPDWNKPEQAVWTGAELVQATVAPLITTSIGPVRYTQRKHVEVTIFDWAKDDHHLFKRWTFGIGVCVTSNDATPFGTLSVAANSIGAVIEAYAISNKPTPGKIGGHGAPVHATEFRSPLTWKAQFTAEVERGAKVKLIKALTPITGTGKGAQVDACAERDVRWPTPATAAGFNVLPANQVQMVTWDSLPKVTMRIDGTRIKLRVEASGFPVFAQQKNAVQHTALDFPTELGVLINVWMAGEKV